MTFGKSNANEVSQVLQVSSNINQACYITDKKWDGNDEMKALNLPILSQEHQHLCIKNKNVELNRSKNCVVVLCTRCNRSWRLGGVLLPCAN